MADFTTLCPHCGLVAFCSVACATAACKTWHGNECVDASGAPLEAAMSAISPECRVALRALRRAEQYKLLEGGGELCEPPTSVATAVSAPSTDAAAAADASDASAVTVTIGSGSSVSSTMVRDTTLSIKLADLDEHYTLRSSRERSLLETEAAIAAVLASGGCADVGTDGVGGRERFLQPGGGVCGSLAADLVTALFKVKRRLCGKDPSALFRRSERLLHLPYNVWQRFCHALPRKCRDHFSRFFMTRMATFLVIDER